MDPLILKPRQINTSENMNVFIAFPAHLLKANDFKFKVQVCGNELNQFYTPIYLNAVLFTTQHYLMDFAMGIVENPELINDNDELREASFLNINDSIYTSGGIINKKIDILYANKSGYVNNFISKILDMNYEIGSFEGEMIRHHIPSMGGYILTDLDAKFGVSGSVVVFTDPETNQQSVVGFVIVSSNITPKEHSENATHEEFKCCASDIYYLYPHILQCTQAVEKFVNGDPIKLAQLCSYSVMKQFQSEIEPTICYLGGDYVFHQINKENRLKYISLKNIHFSIENDLPLRMTQYDSDIPFKTMLNTNQEFVDYFFEIPSSEIMIRSLNYYDKIIKEIVEINFEQNTIFANVLDYCYRGDPAAPLEITMQKKILNDNGSITVTDLKTFRFVSAATTDIVKGQTYKRLTSQIPSIFNNWHTLVKDSLMLRMFHQETQFEYEQERIKLKFLIHKWFERWFWSDRRLLR